MEERKKTEKEEAERVEFREWQKAREESARAKAVQEATTVLADAAPPTPGSPTSSVATEASRTSSSSEKLILQKLQGVTNALHRSEAKRELDEVRRWPSTRFLVLFSRIIDHLISSQQDESFKVRVFGACLGVGGHQGGEGSVVVGLVSAHC